LTHAAVVRLAVLGGCAVAAFTALVPMPAVAAGISPPPLVAAARLQGVFAMTGTITRAVGVPDESPGQSVQRLWTFTPLCQIGACAAVQLMRPREGGVDRVLLLRRSPGLYVGVGSFIAPARCHGVTYRKGMLVPFSISVQITGFGAVGPLVQATQLHAAYNNRKRINLTRCVAAPSYDAAVYGGAVVAVGTTRKVRRT
jgi:hypothetical protein